MSRARTYRFRGELIQSSDNGDVTIRKLAAHICPFGVAVDPLFTNIVIRGGFCQRRLVGPEATCSLAHAPQNERSKQATASRSVRRL
mmetsp:Transcript_4425/g.11308  ORF Transcript_4425/g.11308 Transcript_4425/m.11308 type:complete len:87 (+) Transcript_4425:364-624(+)